MNLAGWLRAFPLLFNQRIIQDSQICCQAVAFLSLHISAHTSVPFLDFFVMTSFNKAHLISFYVSELSSVCVHVLRGCVSPGETHTLGMMWCAACFRRVTVWMKQKQGSQWCFSVVVTFELDLGGWVGMKAVCNFHLYEVQQHRLRSKALEWSYLFMITFNILLESHKESRLHRLFLWTSSRGAR